MKTERFLLVLLVIWCVVLTWQQIEATQELAHQSLALKMMAEIQAEACAQQAQAARTRSVMQSTDRVIIDILGAMNERAEPIEYPLKEVMRRLPAIGPTLDDYK